MDEQLIRVPEAAKRLGVCARKVWEMLSRGVFQRVKHPNVRATCLLRSQVEAYIRQIAGVKHDAIP